MFYHDTHEDGSSGDKHRGDLKAKSTATYAFFVKTKVECKETAKVI